MLVVLGHVISFMNGNFVIARQLCMFIYIFHMPAFAFISGILSTEEKGKRIIKKLFFRIMIPYIIFQIILCLIRLAYYPVNIRDLYTLIFIPQYGLWYIFCIFFWKIILPYYLKLPKPLLLSFAIGLLWGFCLPINGYILSSSRIVAFFPFFLLGHYSKKNQWFLQKVTNNQSGKYRATAVIILICALICSLILKGRLNHDYMYDRFYFEFGQHIWIHFMLRGIAYSTSILVSIAFISLVSKSYNIMTRMGERSMYVYLLHLPIMVFFRYSQALNEITNLCYFFATLLLTVILTLLLSTDTIQRLTRPIVQPYATSNLRNSNK